MNDRNMILDPNQWPAWPLLPLKRPTSDWPECGFIWEGSFTVVIHSIFHLTPDKSLGEQIKDSKKYEYKDVDSLLADGWVVD